MANTALDGRLDQGPRVDRVVAVIAERLAHRVRHHDRRSEMNDGVDLVFLDQRSDELLIAGLGDDQRHTSGDSPVEAGCEVVKHDRALAAVDEGVDHMASDIAGAAGHQHGHLRSIVTGSKSRESPICPCACTPLRPVTRPNAPYMSLRATTFDRTDPGSKGRSLREPRPPAMSD